MPTQPTKPAHHSLYEDFVKNRDLGGVEGTGQLQHEKVQPRLREEGSYAAPGT